MKIRTLEELSDKLAKDLVWRKRELSEIKSLIEQKSLSPQKHNVLLKGGVCILYSHWEGFVKLAASSYLEYVIAKKLKYNQLSKNFLALAMKAQLREAKETNKPSSFIPVCNFFLSQLDQRCSLPEPKDAISTASNLSSEILKEITEILGLDFLPFSTKIVLIDVKLLKSRNEIAHGNDYSEMPDREAYIELHEEVITMLEIFRTQIENSAALKKFMHN
ncbi:MAE_28990/MAE_18760 family HEPN-like nuclease [Pseudanabaena sp. UWO310]|uniref:MAE_28990/MAE_18760 family HEPN-like nuclease n=1 Tax=Pseudanabaena sp. UWO310 TaxID=2480795 RepID=UPI00115AFEE9|nr:MAE_28990/MAE_18760 family HEPN-like nuclease [Pseudanabaena sp. UWO310]TYQ27297.1 hypothetical protein PseudUWO310_15900 [Pseudanabaena sp. UWO310]